MVNMDKLLIYLDNCCFNRPYDDQERKRFASRITNNNEHIVKIALSLVTSGFGNKDALHIATALEMNVDYFLTVDKGILKKRNLVEGLTILNPVDFISIVEDTYAN